MSNYPKTRKPTGPRPNAGRPATLDQPVKVTAYIETTDRDWLLTQAPTVAEALRALITAAREAKARQEPGWFLSGIE
jgi:hypothetical protein